MNNPELTQPDGTDPGSTHPSGAPHTGPRLALVSRGDPLTPYLHAALAQRYPVVADVHVELAGARRTVVGAVTFRPTWSRWADRYMKSNLGFAARSRWARRQLDDITEPFDLVFQTHALFRTHRASTVIYVDCTYREAMAGWPEWSPLRGSALTRWLDTEQDTYRQAAHLFTLTEPSRESLIADYGIAPSKISVVGAGVNFPAPPRTTSRDDSPERPTILFVGKDFERKGGPLLLTAFAKVRDEFPDARLQVVGTRVPGTVPDGVDVLGVISDRARMHQLYSRADLFCLPSLFDPSPLVVLEAMGHGLPCVLSEGCAAHVRSLVDDGSGGWLARTGDVDGLAAGMIAYLRDPELAWRVGDTARRAMTAQHTWDRVVDRMAPTLERLSAQQRHANRS